MPAMTARPPSIIGLKGFGLYQDEETRLRRAKRATAVLRFLKDTLDVVNEDWACE